MIWPLTVPIGAVLHHEVPTGSLGNSYVSIGEKSKLLNSKTFRLIIPIVDVPPFMDALSLFVLAPPPSPLYPTAVCCLLSTRLKLDLMLSPILIIISGKETQSACHSFSLLYVHYTSSSSLQYLSNCGTETSRNRRSEMRMPPPNRINCRISKYLSLCTY